MSRTGSSFESRRLHDEVRARLFGGDDGSTRVGRWRILERLGRGGMGTVYRASAEGTEVALKIVAGNHPAHRARLQREARALRELRHPHVVGIVEVGEFEAGSYVAMELVRGESLRARMAQARSVAQWVALLGPIAEALGAVQAAGLVHRDVKPDNILVDAAAVVTLVDFGLAKPEPGSAAAEASGMGESLTSSGAGVGTVGYAAPEQMLGRPVDHRADQFGFAVTLWEAIFGELPFAGATADAIGLAAIAGRVRAPTRPREDAARILPALQRALAADPAARHRDTAALLAALR
ncbi:MAG: serine/threonine protein kinase [Nannocystaceae bacterium]|nr:serine/threonine protein kinase [Nannocystaceae bacterium]